MANHQLPRSPAASTHPGGRGGAVRRPFGDPIAAPAPAARFIPPPPTNRVNFVLPLQAVMPTDWIDKAGQLVIHVAGDTGGVNDGSVVQKAVADQMESQVRAAAKSVKPALFYHLGDVVYFNGQSTEYDSQFYEPYKFYEPYIFAIPGNHDGDTSVRKNDAPDAEPTLTGFTQNFCDDQPHHVSDQRETVTQPYVYWTLDAPFVTIIGLYSNVEGLLDGRGSIEQQQWFENQLQSAAKDKCLLVAVHHPPYSLDRPHGGSPDIVASIDQAIKSTGRIPDAVFSGHVHSYQRFTRTIEKRPVPYVVAGAAGYAHDPKAMHQLQRDDRGNPIKKLPFQTLEKDVVLANYNETDPGFLRLTIDDQALVGEYFTVPFSGSPPTKPADQFTLNWKKHTLHP